MRKRKPERSSRFLTKTFLPPKIEQVVLAGCGGTGSILAEHLARMIAGFRLEAGLTLMDGDIVSEGNVARQNFQPYDVGQPKAQVLSLRLAGQFGLEISALCRRLEAGSQMPAGTLVITATDTVVSRRWAAGCGAAAWLDVGNELHHGQAVLGSTHAVGALAAEWGQWETKPHCHALPDMAALSPSILRAEKDLPALSCADQPFGVQGFGVNAMAALAAACIARQLLVDQKVATPQVYFDVHSGRMGARRIERVMFAPWGANREAPRLA